MADISQYLNAILQAVYGEDVRGSIYNAIDIINKVGEKTITLGTAITATNSPTSGYYNDSLYLNTNTWDLWKCTGSSWDKQGNLKGTTIASVTKTGTSGLVDSYRINGSDGANLGTFDVTNGANGTKGDQGIQGIQGIQGEMGYSVRYCTYDFIPHTTPVMAVASKNDIYPNNGISVGDIIISGKDTSDGSYQDFENCSFAITFWRVTALTETQVNLLSINSFGILTGSQGPQGVSPTVTMSKSGKVTTLVITDASGDHVSTIRDGEDGSGTGDMLKSTYDANDDGIVDQAASVPWSGVTNKTAMTGATASGNGVMGLVPAPSAGDQDKCLKGDGTWGNVAEDVSGKADKVSNATNNNFAALDANGNLKDSGKSDTTYTTELNLKQPKTLATSIKVLGSTKTTVESTLQAINNLSLSFSTASNSQILNLLNLHRAGIINLTDYWNVGDTRHVGMSPIDSIDDMETQPYQDLELVILHGPNFYNLYDSGSTKNSFVIGVKTSLKTPGKINATAVTAGGWKDCKRRTWLNSNDFMRSLPPDVLAWFKPFRSKSGKGNGSNEVYELTDLFTLPSRGELCGSSDGMSASDEPTDRFDYFKEYRSIANMIWTRSPYMDAYSFCVAQGSNNSWGAYGANNSYYFFVIGCV